MKLYGKLAAWWPLLSASPTRPRPLLELGPGADNHAFHLKKLFQMTLVDRSPRMLKVSRALNPDCRHLRGGMRSVRLHRLFDAVFIRDAIAYMATVEELKRALDTAYITYLLEEGRRVRSGGLDEHVCGLFSGAEWLQLRRKAGSRAEMLPFEHSGVGQGERCLFRGIKP